LPEKIKFKAIVSGSYHVCIIGMDDLLSCWQTEEFTDALDADGYKAVTAGLYHTCGIRNDGRVDCWHYGRAVMESDESPEGFFKAIAAGDSHTCGIRTDNSVICWNFSYSPPPR